MGRLFIILALFVVVGWWLFSRAARSQGDGAQKSGARRTRGGSEPEALQEMVPCAHCGMHVPRAEAISDGRDLYCGEPHRLLGPRS